MSAYISISLPNLQRNFLTIASLCKHDIKICPSIKADAYGHGLVECATALEKLKNKRLHAFGVSRIDEIKLLRKNKIKTPIIIYSAMSLYDLKELFSDSSCSNIEFFVGSIEYIKDILKVARKLGVQEKISVHIKCDTGMGRLGALPRNFSKIYEYALSEKNIHIAGVCTHLSDSADDLVTEAQYKKFSQILKKNNINSCVIHAANSGGVLWQPRFHYNVVRPGLILYGANPETARKLPNNCTLLPVMKYYSYVSSIKKLPKNHGVSYLSTYKTKRPTHIAIVNVGYADGFPIELSNVGKVRIREKNYSLVGRVCMDMIMIDIGNNSSIACGDEAIFWGDKKLTVDMQAEYGNTISYQLLCNAARTRPIKSFIDK